MAVHATEKPNTLQCSCVQAGRAGRLVRWIRLGSPPQNQQRCPMIRPLSGLLLALLLPLVVQAEPAPFQNAQHRVSGIIPNGWKELPTSNPETALKISREGAGNDTARITITTYPVPPGTYPAAFDVWKMTDKQIRESGESGSDAGEKVTVLKFGRGEIDHQHVVWTLNHRTLQDNTVLWQLAYEGLRGTDGFTVQLTVTGDETWYTTNADSFAVFIRVLRLAMPKAAK